MNWTHAEQRIWSCMYLEIGGASLLEGRIYEMDSQTWIPYFVGYHVKGMGSYPSIEEAAHAVNLAASQLMSEALLKIVDGL